MKISDLIDNWEPGDWPSLKHILKEMAGDKDVPSAFPPDKDND